MSCLDGTGEEQEGHAAAVAVHPVVAVVVKVHPFAEAVAVVEAAVAGSHQDLRLVEEMSVRLVAKHPFEGHRHHHDRLRDSSCLLFLPRGPLLVVEDIEDWMTCCLW